MCKNRKILLKQKYEKKTTNYSTKKEEENKQFRTLLFIISVNYNRYNNLLTKIVEFYLNNNKK